MAATVRRCSNIVCHECTQSIILVTAVMGRAVSVIVAVHLASHHWIYSALLQPRHSVQYSAVQCSKVACSAERCSATDSVVIVSLYLVYACVKNKPMRVRSLCAIAHSSTEDTRLW